MRQFRKPASERNGSPERLPRTGGKGAFPETHKIEKREHFSLTGLPVELTKRDGSSVNSVTQGNDFWATQSF